MDSLIFVKFIKSSPILRCLPNTHSWVSTIIIKPSQLAIICMSFAAYAVEAFASECEPDPGIVQLTAVATVAVVTFVNCWSVN